METVKNNISIGDSIKVKYGVKDPDFEDHEIGGWQGRVTQIQDNPDSFMNPEL